MYTYKAQLNQNNCVVSELEILKEPTYAPIGTYWLSLGYVIVSIFTFLNVAIVIQQINSPADLCNKDICKMLKVLHHKYEETPPPQNNSFCCCLISLCVSFPSVNSKESGQAEEQRRNIKGAGWDSFFFYLFIWLFRGWTWRGGERWSQGRGAEIKASEVWGLHRSGWDRVQEDVSRRQAEMWRAIRVWRRDGSTLYSPEQSGDAKEGEDTGLICHILFIISPFIFLKIVSF